MLRFFTRKLSTPKPVEIPGFRQSGEIPTNFQVATGNERYEYLEKLKGNEPWKEMFPISLKTQPTIDSPFELHGVDPVRYVGCTGFPADTHECLWLTVGTEAVHSCPHCGNAFKYIQHEMAH